MTGTFNAHIKEAITEYCTFEVLWPSWPTDKEILTKVAYYTLQCRGPILTQEKASWIKEVQIIHWNLCLKRGLGISFASE